MTETDTQRTGLLHFAYQPVSAREKADTPDDIEGFLREANERPIGRAIWRAVNDGRAYVVEDLGERDDDSVDGFIRQQRVRTVRITLQHMNDAEVGEWVTEDAFPSMDRQTYYYAMRPAYGDTDSSRRREIEWRHREGWGWQRVR